MVSYSKRIFSIVNNTVSGWRFKSFTTTMQILTKGDLISFYENDRDPSTLKQDSYHRVSYIIASPNGEFLDSGSIMNLVSIRRSLALTCN